MSQKLSEIYTANEITTLTDGTAFYCVPDAAGTPTSAAILNENLATEMATHANSVTASNVGSGAGTEYGFWKDKSTATLRFKKIKQGSGITLTENTNDITVAASTTAVVIPVDLSNNAVDDIAVLSRLNTANDTNSVVTNNTGSEVLVDMGQNWPSADSIKFTVTQAGHTFGAKEVAYHNGTQWVEADVDTIATSQAVGVIESTDGNDFVIVMMGKITVSGLSAGSTYYLSSTTGVLTTVKPSTAMPVAVMVAQSTTVAYVNIHTQFDGTNLTTLTSPDSTADYVNVYDGSVSRWKRALWPSSTTTGGGGGGLSPTTVKTADYTASAGELVLCDPDAAGATFGIKLPDLSYGSTGDRVKVVAVDSSTTKQISIDANGGTIDGSAAITEANPEGYVLTQWGDSIEFTRVGDDTGWASSKSLRPHVGKWRKESVQSAIVTATDTVVDWSSATEEIAAGVTQDVANDRWTIRRDGIYVIHFHVTFISLADGTLAQAKIFKNGSEVSGNTLTTTGSINHSTLHVTDTLILNSGDNITFKVYHDNGSDRSIGGATGLATRAHIIEQLAGSGSA